ncbi:MAG TPA: hypothetical protein VH234_03370 [Candidatus Saccharimonadales bacterium]|nr:hypothetical protein [Candidatus Saccharimonadales bacterium]
MPPQDQSSYPPVQPPVQQPGQSYPPPLPNQPGAEQPPHPNYDFIVNPPAAPKKPLAPLLSGSTSTIKRAGIFVIGLLVLIIIVAVFKNLLAGHPKLDSMVTVAQDQQELIHIATNANQQQNLAGADQNLMATVQLSVNSAQSQIMTYFSSNNFKVTAKTLNLGVKGSIDQQLTNAATAGTYDQTLQDVMKSQLNSYLGNLQQAYNHITGSKGRALLKSDYHQAQLLQNELNGPTAGS